MKKTFYIIILLLAISFTTPNSEFFSQRVRHVIEFNYEDKKKKLKDSDIIKNKAVLFVKLHLILQRIEQINYVYSLNYG